MRDILLERKYICKYMYTISECITNRKAVSNDISVERQIHQSKIHIDLVIAAFIDNHLKYLSNFFRTSKKKPVKEWFTPCILLFP